MGTKIIAVYTKQKDIKKITDVLKRYCFDDLPQHTPFELSVMEKLTDINKISETFPKFELVQTIELRKNDKGQRHYSLNYELEDESFIVISVALDKKKPLIINAFHAKTNYKRFEKSLRKHYSKKFI